MHSNITASSRRRCGVDEKIIKAAESILAKGDRVELIPVKDGVKVLRVKREEIKKSPGEPGD